MRGHKKRSFSLTKTLAESWWVLLFCVFVSMLYFQKTASKRAEIQHLTDIARNLELKKCMALEKKSDLSRKLLSHHDPHFVELVLMERFGVVPEGGIKVSFDTNECEVSLSVESS